MFPETFVEKHLVYSREDDLVFDPFSGRGTTAFQALLSNRRAICSDVSAVASCVSKSKVDFAYQSDVLNRLEDLRNQFEFIDDEAFEDEFYQNCFSRKTLEQLVFLRQALRWSESREDAFISSLVLGSLHGESHRSVRYLSNRMPRTIATKPEYSIRWWKKYDYTAPVRDVFDNIRSDISYRFDSGVPCRRGKVVQTDARLCGEALAGYDGQVKLVITSPPYLDTTHFGEDQWLRNWFLGGQLRPKKVKRADDRHTSKASYWEFLESSWRGMASLLSDGVVHVVIRIGGAKVSFDEAKNGVVSTLERGLHRDIRLKSASISEISGGQLRSFRPSAKGTKREYDVVVAVH